MKIRLIFLGKTRRAECRAMLEDYLARVRRYADLEVAELREDSAALRRFELDSADTNVLLDAAGPQRSTADFAKWLRAHRERGDSRTLNFLCGADEGFPESLARQANAKLSLSALTMPHELARVVLAEQIYRAFTIMAGHPYSK